MNEKRKEEGNVKKKWFWILVVCLFFLVGLFAFRCVLGEDRIFSASDSNIGLLARSKALPPSGFFGYFFSAPIHGTSGSKVPSFGTFLFHLSSIEFFNNWRYMLYLLVSTVSLIGFLRLRRISRIGSVLGSLVAFWVGSVTLASAGHDGKFAVAMFFSVSLFLIEKMVQQSVRWRRACYAVLCGGTIGCMLLEQQDIGLLFGCFPVDPAVRSGLECVAFNIDTDRCDRFADRCSHRSALLREEYQAGGFCSVG